MSIATLILIGIIFLIGVIAAIVQKNPSIYIISLTIASIIIIILLITGPIIEKNVAPDILAEEKIVDIIPLDLKDKYYLGVENKEELYWYLTKKDDNITELKYAPISKSVINNSDENKRTYVLIYHKTYSNSLKFFFGFILHDEQEYIFYIPKDAIYYNFEIN
jgi:hypothetical protein